MYNGRSKIPHVYKNIFEPVYVKNTFVWKRKKQNWKRISGNTVSDDGRDGGGVKHAFVLEEKGVYGVMSYAKDTMLNVWYKVMRVED